VSACSRRDYDEVMSTAVKNFPIWRAGPAPQRGELVRRIGLELRRRKDELGRLIALETGKIKAEGDGEVQEMRYRRLRRGTVAHALPSDDNTVAEQFVADPRVSLISFTGSSAVGRHVAEVVARRMGKYLLECSGNNAVIVDETANLDLALRTIVFGVVGTAGQRCTSTRRLIVHEARYSELVARLVDGCRGVVIGDPLDPHTLMGPLIDEAARERFRAAMAELKKLDAEILYGAEVLPGPGYFVQPTLARARPEWDIVRLETFAPILYVMPYRTLAEAITIHNDVPQGLSSALFTENLQHAEHFLSAAGSDCGIANVNIGTSGAEIGGAFGGEKETGGGREAGSDAWRAYMRRQTNTINWGADLPLAQGIRFGN
jgi:aldehyde dehydrogenase (NAD+)